MARETTIVKCHICGKEFEKENRRIKQSVKLGKPNTCSRSCASKITNNTRIAPPSTRQAESVRRGKEKFPEKDKARKLVRQAIKTKKIIPPDVCSQCGKSCRPEAHHEDHSRPFYINWLCDECHAFHDRYKLMGYGIDYSEIIRMMNQLIPNHIDQHIVSGMGD